VLGLAPNMAMIVLSEKPRTNVAHPAVPVRTLGWGGRMKVPPATGSAGLVQMKPREPKRMVAPGVCETMWSSIRVVGEVRRDTRCAPTWHANYGGSLPPDSKFVSIMCSARMVSTGDNRIYTGSGLRGVIPYVQCRVAMFPC
jgi:hypothetical protein